MKVKEALARKMCRSLGLNDKDWGAKVLKKKLNQLPSLSDSLNKPEDPQDFALFQSVCTAIAEGDEIEIDNGKPEPDDDNTPHEEVVSSEETQESEEREVTEDKDMQEEAEVETTPKKRGRPKKDREEKVDKKTKPKAGKDSPKPGKGETKHPDKKEGKKPVKEEKKTEKPAKADKKAREGKATPVREKVPLDKYGSRQGTQAALINTCLSVKPQSMKEIQIKANAIGVCHTVFNQLKTLEDKGFLEHTDDKKWKLVKKDK